MERSSRERERASHVIASTSPRPDVWTDEELTVGTGARDHVCPSEALATVLTIPREMGTIGVTYEVADGRDIANEGETKCMIAEEGAESAGIFDFPVCDVSKALLRVGKMVKDGKRVVFDSEQDGGAKIVDKTTGKKRRLVSDGNLWKLKAWVKKARLARLCSPSQKGCPIECHHRHSRTLGRVLAGGRPATHKFVEQIRKSTQQKNLHSRLYQRR